MFDGFAQLGYSYQNLEEFRRFFFKTILSENMYLIYNVCAILCKVVSL